MPAKGAMCTLGDREGRERKKRGKKVVIDEKWKQRRHEPVTPKKEIRQSGFSTSVSDIFDQIIAFNAGLSCAANDAILCSRPLPIEC